MDEQLVRFIAHLRAVGVRISLAESQDAARALAHLADLEPEWVRAALQTTLIKESTDQPLFDRFFPLYFFNPGAARFILPEQTPTRARRQLLAEALAGESNHLLQKLASGQSPTPQEWERSARQVRAKPLWGPVSQARLAREMLRQMGLRHLAAQIEKLRAELARQGMTPDGLEAVQRLIEANLAALTAQAAQAISRPPVRELTDLPDDPDLMERAFNQLSAAEAEELRRQVRRLAAKLRSRAALRQKKGRGKLLDAKTTLRANLRTGGIPFHLHFKKKRPKPKFTLICDVSTSMRPVAEFMLRLMYGMQDQMGKVRSFAFNDHLEEVSDDFVGRRPDEAISQILGRLPPVITPSIWAGAWLISASIFSMRWTAAPSLSFWGMGAITPTIPGWTCLSKSSAAPGGSFGSTLSRPVCGAQAIVICSATNPCATRCSR